MTATSSVPVERTFLQQRVQLAMDEIESGPKRNEKSLSLRGARKYALARIFEYQERTKRISDRIFIGTAIAAALVSVIAVPISFLHNAETTATFLVGGLIGIAISLIAIVANNIPRLSDGERASIADYLRAKVHESAITSLEGSIRDQNNLFLTAAGVVGISGLNWLFEHAVHFISQRAQLTDLVWMPFVSIIGVVLWTRWTNELILRVLSLSKQ